LLLFVLAVSEVPHVFNGSAGNGLCYMVLYCLAGKTLYLSNWSGSKKWRQGVYNVVVGIYGMVALVAHHTESNIM
jgi:hypothetical protein